MMGVGRCFDCMSNYLADEVHSRLGKAGRVLMLGLTFKEDVPDLRNSKVVNVIERLIAAVPHARYRGWNGEDIARIVESGGLVADIKGIWRDVELPPDLRRWQL